MGWPQQENFKFPIELQELFAQPTPLNPPSLLSPTYCSTLLPHITASDTLMFFLLLTPLAIF